jgi:hypothetical protein
MIVERLAISEVSKVSSEKLNCSSEIKYFEFSTKVKNGPCTKVSRTMLSCTNVSEILLISVSGNPFFFSSYCRAVRSEPRYIQEDMRTLEIDQKLLTFHRRRNLWKLRQDMYLILNGMLRS